MSNTIERLKNYGLFDEAIVEQIGRVAADQNSRSFRELADNFGVADGPSQARPFGDDRLLEFYKIGNQNPTGGDPTRTRVYFAPMATPADQNMAVRAFRFYAVDPSIPLMVVGSPAAVGRPANKLSIRGARIVKNGNMAPLVAPTLRYLESTSNTNCDFIGYSYGADAAAAASVTAKDYGITANHGVWMEPASVKIRTILELGRAFVRAGQLLEGCVNATGSPVLDEARREADVGMMRYVGGMLRLSNIAVAYALAKSSFAERAQTALQSQSNLQTTLVWGNQSELSDDAEMWDIASHLRSEFGRSRVRSLRVPGMHHVGGDDIDLHAALVLQSLADQATTAK